MWSAPPSRHAPTWRTAHRRRFVSYVSERMRVRPRRPSCARLCYIYHFVSLSNVPSSRLRVAGARLLAAPRRAAPHGTPGAHENGAACGDGEPPLRTRTPIIHSAARRISRKTRRNLLIPRVPASAVVVLRKCNLDGGMATVRAARTSPPLNVVPRSGTRRAPRGVRHHQGTTLNPRIKRIKRSETAGAGWQGPWELGPSTTERCNRIPIAI